MEEVTLNSIIASCLKFASNQDSEHVGLNLILSRLKQVFFEEFAIIFNFTSSQLERWQQTLYHSTIDFSKIKEIRKIGIGSADARYFTTDSKTKSKQIVHNKRSIDEFAASADSDLQMILHSDNLPEEIIKLDVQVNSALYYFGNGILSATPDGTCIIDGVVCPVEVMRKNDVVIPDRKIRKGFDLGTNASREVKTKELNRAKSLSKKAKAARESRALSEMDEDFEYFINKRKAKREDEKMIPESVSNLSKSSDKDTRSDEFRRRSKGQRERMLRESLKFIAEPPVDMIQSKSSQLDVQMFCMCANAALVFNICKNGILYSIVPRRSGTNTRALSIVSNTIASLVE